MQSYPVKIDNISSLGSDEYNDLAGGELNNFVQNSGQTLSGGNASQMGVAAANYGSHGDFYTDSGSANAYVLATQASKKGVNAYVDGMRIRFKVGNTNTGASTINVNSLGVKDIKQPGGVALTAGQLTVGDFVTILFNSSSDFFVLSASLVGSVTPVIANSLDNVGIKVSFSAGDMTVTLKQRDGLTDPSSLSPVKISMRDTSQPNGGFGIRSVIAALSTVISSGSTLGLTDVVESKVYVYAIGNGTGGVELATSQRLIPEDELITTVAEGGAGAADDKFVIYSTTARSGVPFQLLGYIISTQTTAGTWAQAPTNIWIGREEYREKIIYLKDEKSGGTDGGTFTSGSWQTRDLGILTGNISIVNLSSDQFTLGAGEYDIEVSAPAFAVQAHKIKLRNITDATDDIIGGSSHSNSGAPQTTNSLLYGNLILTSSKTYEIQHRGTTTGTTTGFGVASNFSVVEVYTQVKITKTR